MTTGSSSARLLRKPLAPALHEHDEPPEEAPECGPPPEDVCAAAACDESAPAGRLWREDGRVMYCPAGGGEAVAARVVWARPLSGREDGPVSVMLADKKREVGYFPSLSALSGESRRVAEEELAGSLFLPRITAVYSVRPRFGNYYWDVETDVGRRRFLMSSPENNTFHPKPDVIVLKDVVGNCFEVPSLSGLSKASLAEMNRVL